MRLFATGTMRTGGSLLMNILSFAPQIQMFHTKVNFFRNIYGRYKLDDSESIKEMLHHQKIRMKYRADLTFDDEAAYAFIGANAVSDANVYDRLMRFLLEDNRVVWGEYEVLQWRQIPTFLSLFPDNAKTIQIIRDPRSVLGSFSHSSFLENHGFLVCLFNWIDSARYMLDFSDKLDHDSYLPVFFEDLHRDPRNAVSRLSQFLGIDIDREVLDSDCWSKKLETQSTYINFSSVNGDKVYGFDKARVDYWVDKLPKWQLALAEFLCGSLMTEIGYLKSGEYAEYDLEEGLNILRSNVFLQKCYEEYQLQGVGTNKLPLDPYLPENWASRSNPRAKFIDTPDYEQFLREFKF